MRCAMSTDALDLATLAADAADNHPEPSPVAAEVLRDAQQQHAPDAAQQQHATAAQQATQQRDRSGATWNAAQHAYPPRLTTRGTWAKRRAGDAQTPQPCASPAPTPAAQQPTDAQPGVVPQLVAGPSPHEAAQLWAARFFAVATSLMGDHWQPTPPEEKDVASCLGRYFEIHGSIDLPPGWALVVAVATYALPRSFHPDSIKTFKRFAGRVGSWFGRKPATHDQGGDTLTLAA